MSCTVEIREETVSCFAEEPRIHASGCGGLLFDVAARAFNEETQRRLWALSAKVRETYAEKDILDVVPGVNNLLVVMDPLRLHPDQMRKALMELWESIDANALSARDIEIPVVYGGAVKEDLLEIAGILNMVVQDIVELHSSAVYTVACIGAMPGFGYLSGLPAELAVPRLASPRASVLKGSVIIGGSQAGVMPCTAPSGWHILGETDLDMFDASKASPCLLAPGDRVRFRVKEVRV